jgi:hypothetical protein
MSASTLPHKRSASARIKSSDFFVFLRALFCGQPFEPTIRNWCKDARSGEPGQDGWLAYYGVCVQYISSLHNQFIAVLSIQGALAIGCLAAIHSLRESHRGGHLSFTLGFVGLLMELALTWIGGKLFRQHCVACWMLARIEQEKLGLPNWACIKALLGTQGNRLFTSPSTLLLTVTFGLALGVGLALGGIMGL